MIFNYILLFLTSDCSYNKERELTETKKAAHRDLFNVRKVDTHIHHSACMHPRELLLFVQKKAKVPNKSKIY